MGVRHVLHHGMRFLKQFSICHLVFCCDFCAQLQSSCAACYAGTLHDEVSGRGCVQSCAVLRLSPSLKLRSQSQPGCERPKKSWPWPEPFRSLCSRDLWRVRLSLRNAILRFFVLSSTSLASLLSLRRKLANSLPVKDCEIFRANSPMCTTMFIEYANEHPGRSVFARVVGSMHLTFIRPCHRVLELSRQPSGAC